MPRKRISEENLSFDISIGDLMAGLLLIFILLLITTLFSLQKEFETKQNIAQEYKKGQEEIFLDLQTEFEKDLEFWDADIDRLTLAIRFKNPDLLFMPNKSELNNKFQKVLEDFFPRYIKVLFPKYESIIDEIRIEGHTAKDMHYTYLNHMELSQDRTNEVLRFVLGQASLGLAKEYLYWVQSCLSATGLAYSKPIFINGKEDWDLSRRVEFRIRTNSEEKIEEILNIGKLKNE